MEDSLIDVEVGGEVRGVEEVGLGGRLVRESNGCTRGGG